VVSRKAVRRDSPTNSSRYGAWKRRCVRAIWPRMLHHRRLRGGFQFTPVPLLSGSFSPIAYLARHCPPNTSAMTDAHYRPDTPRHQVGHHRDSGRWPTGLAEHLPLIRTDQPLASAHWAGTLMAAQFASYSHHRGVRRTDAAASSATTERALSKTSRTLRARLTALNGLLMNFVPGSKTP
jgi:hypothetical protein